MRDQKPRRLISLFLRIICSPDQVTSDRPTRSGWSTCSVREGFSRFSSPKETNTLRPKKGPNAPSLPLYGQSPGFCRGKYHEPLYSCGSLGQSFVSFIVRMSPAHGPSQWQNFDLQLDGDLQVMIFGQKDWDLTRSPGETAPLWRPTRGGSTTSQPGPVTATTSTMLRTRPSKVWPWPVFYYEKYFQHFSCLVCLQLWCQKWKATVRSTTFKIHQEYSDLLRWI